MLDKEADFSTLPNQDPRISTFIQRQADDYEEKSGASEEDYPCSEKNILLSRTKARVFADPVAVVDAIMGGDPFRLVRSCVAFEDLLEEEEIEDGTATKVVQAIISVEGDLYEFILRVKKGRRGDLAGGKEIDFECLPSPPEDVRAKYRKVRKDIEHEGIIRTDLRVSIHFDVQDAGAGTSFVVCTSWTEANFSKVNATRSGLHKAMSTISSLDRYRSRS